VTEHSSGEVPDRAKRRTFTAAYKLKIAEEYEAASPGERGAVLRREGLYSSHLTEWRKARDAGALAGLAPTRGRPAADPVERDNERLRVRNSRLEADLDTARRVIEVQGKVSALLPETAGLLIKIKHHRPLRRIHIQPDDVNELCPRRQWTAPRAGLVCRTDGPLGRRHERVVTGGEPRPRASLLPVLGQI